MALPDLASTDRPLASAAAAMIGPAGATIMGIAAIVSISGNTAASILSAPRMTYAMARDHGLPAFFASVHPRWNTPHWSVLFYGALAFALATSGSFVWLAGMSTFARLIGYGLCVGALPRLKRRFGGQPGALRLPGGFTIPAIALGVCAWLLTQVERDAMWVTAGFVAAGWLMFAWSGRQARRA